MKLRGSVLWRSRVIWLSQTFLFFQVVFWSLWGRYFFRREAGALKPKLLDFLLLKEREKALKKFADLQSTRIMNLIYQKSQFSSTQSVDGCAHCAPTCPLPFWCFFVGHNESKCVTTMKCWLTMKKREKQIKFSTFSCFTSHFVHLRDLKRPLATWLFQVQFARGFQRRKLFFLYLMWWSRVLRLYFEDQNVIIIFRFFLHKAKKAKKSQIRLLKMSQYTVHYCIFFHSALKCHSFCCAFSQNVWKKGPYKQKSQIKLNCP